MFFEGGYYFTLLLDQFHFALVFKSCWLLEDTDAVIRLYFHLNRAPKSYTDVQSKLLHRAL